MLLRHCAEAGQERGGGPAAMLVRDRNGDTALHLLAQCSGAAAPAPPKCCFDNYTRVRQAKVLMREI